MDRLVSLCSLLFLRARLRRVRRVWLEGLADRACVV